MRVRVLYIVVIILCFGCEPCARYAPPRDLVIHSGDLIFRRGDSKESYAVIFADESDEFYSHCGVIVEVDSVLCAIHSVPDEVPDGGIDVVKCEPLEVFFGSDRSTSGAIYRTPLSNKALEIICRQAKYHVAKRTPFDGQFIIEDSSELYCTEFLHHIFIKGGYDLMRNYSTHTSTPLVGSDSILYPCDLLKNPELLEVYSY